ncbi:MAG: right-handed parallel beta-helix repeat-containing protein [Algibacter sp.]
MSPTNYVRFQKERAKKTKDYILNDAIDTIQHNYYKAKVKLGNDPSASKLKLFGLYPDHFGDSDGHSFRIKFDGETGFGKKKVNVLKPISRSFNLDRMVNIIFKKTFNGLDIASEPVNVIFNKKTYGIYLIEDFFDKYLIEGNLNRESLIFEIINNKAYFNHVPKHEKFSVQQTIIDDLVSESDFKNFIKLIDEEMLFGFMALSLIINDNHNALDINLHWYYNPLANTFEPTIRETKIAHIEKEVLENEFNSKLNSIIGTRNKVLTDWMSSMSTSKFNSGISKALAKIENQFNIILEDSSYINFKYKLIGFNSYMTKNEKLFHENIQTLKRKQYPELIKSIETIRITKDTIINRDIIISKNKSLIIEAGTKVTFTNNSDLIVKSGQLTVNGTDTNGVQFVTNKNSESSIYINSKKDTKISYASFTNLSALNKGLWKLPSSITLFESNATFLNCEFLDNKSGDDMVNVFSCKDVVFKNCAFSNIKSDAIDSDFSIVDISDCNFTKIGNDAIDGSGSTISINNSFFQYIEDKAISAGEESRFTTVSNTIKNSELGIVSKDGSHLISQNNQLTNNTIDLVLFKKKPIYSYPSLKLINTKINSNLVEKGSHFIGLTHPIFAKNINKKLYGNEYGKATE